MKQFEKAMLEHARKWRKFGEGDEYLLPEFGLPVSEFYLRLFLLLRDSAAEIDEVTKDQLGTFCKNKLAEFSGRPVHRRGFREQADH